MTEYTNSGSSERNDVLETANNNVENNPLETAHNNVENNSTRTDNHSNYHGSVDITQYDYGTSSARSLNQESENIGNNVGAQDTLDVGDTYDGSVEMTNYDKSTSENAQPDSGRQRVSVRLRRQTEPSDHLECAPHVPPIRSKIQRLSLPVIPTQDQFHLKPNRWSFQHTPSKSKTRHSFRIERLTSV